MSRDLTTGDDIIQRPYMMANGDGIYAVISKQASVRVEHKAHCNLEKTVNTQEKA